MLAPSFQSGYGFCQCGFHNGLGPEHIFLSESTGHFRMLEKMQEISELGL